MTDALRERLMSIHVVLIRRPDESHWWGPVEHSFSLGTSPNQTFFYWSSLPDSGYDPPIDGLAWLRKDLKGWEAKNPTWKYYIFDAHDPELPVTIDWERWLSAHEPDGTKLSGIANKYYARNFQIAPKPEYLEKRIQRKFEFVEA